MGMILYLWTLNFEFHIIFTCHEIVFFFWFSFSLPTIFKNVKPFLGHRPHVNRQWAKFGSWFVGCSLLTSAINFFFHLLQPVLYKGITDTTLCMHTYVHIYTCMYLHIYTHIYVYAYIYIVFMSYEKAVITPTKPWGLIAKCQKAIFKTFNLLSYTNAQCTLLELIIKQHLWIITSDCYGEGVFELTFWSYKQLW